MLALNLLKHRVKYLREVRRYAAPLGKTFKEKLNDKGYPERLRGFPINIQHDPHLSPESQVELENRLESHFGPEIFHPENLTKLVKASGAIPGSKVTIGFGPSGGVSVSHEHQNPGLLRADRTYFKDRDGHLVQSADIQQAHDSIQGGGARRFKETIGHLRDLGVKRIDTHGVGQVGSDANGYYTWPRFGFNGTLNHIQFFDQPEHIQQELNRRGKRDFHTLFSIPGAPPKDAQGNESPDHTLSGAASWKKFGTGNYASFDLHPESPHSKNFEEYLNGKAQSSNQGTQPQPGALGAPSGAENPLGPTGGTAPPDVRQGSGGTGDHTRRTQTGRRAASSNQGHGVKPNQSLSRKNDNLLKYAGKRVEQPLDPLIAHAAHAMDHPLDDAAMTAFADHLQERHPDHPVTEQFANFVTRQPGAWEAVAKHVHPRYINSFVARGPHTPQMTQEAQEAVAGNPLVGQQMADMARYHFVQDPRMLRNQNSYPRGEAYHTVAKPEGFSRGYGEALWNQVSSKKAQGNPYLSHASLAKKNTSAQVAKHVYDKLGPAGLVHLLVGLRHFHPDEQARRETEGTTGVKFSRGKPKRYAKIDADVQPHHLVEGFPISHALRHLANDPANPDDIRNLSKAAFTGRDENGKEMHGGPGPALWMLHDALQEHNHPAKDWYKWMNAADKIHIDSKVYEALRRVAKENDLAHPQSREQAEREAVVGRRANTSLGQHTPEGVVFRINHRFLGNRQLRDRARAHLSQIDPSITPKLFNESLKRHAARAAYKWVKDGGWNADAKAHEDRALSNGKVNLKDASTYHKIDPKYTEDKATRYAKRDLITGKTTPENFYPEVAPQGKKILSPVENTIAAKGPTKELSNNLLKSSVNNQPGVIPTVRELTALAHAGGSTRGQYAHSYKVISDFIGPKNADLWVAANAILSPQSAWEEHSRGAMRALRMWHDAGRPTDPKEVARLVTDPLAEQMNNKGTRLYSLYDASKRSKLVDVFSNPQKYFGGKGSIQKSGWGKITDFRGSFHNPGHAALDTHQSKLTVPGVDEIHAAIDRLAAPERGDTSQQIKDKKIRAIQSHKDLDSAHESVQKLAGGSHLSHALAQSISGATGNQLPAALLNAQKKVISIPYKYKAYKSAVGQAAHQLGWEPREVQEAVWTAVVSIVAAKNYGLPTEKILKKLQHEDAFHAWNVGHILSSKEILDDIGLLKSPRRSLGDFVKAAQKAPAETGAIRTGDDATYQDVAARIPPVDQKGAWTPVTEALRARKASRKGQAKKYSAPIGSDNFLDALRHISASNNLAPVAEAIAKKLGAQGIAMPALHDTNRGSVPGVAMAVYGNQDPHAVHYLASQIALSNSKKNKGMLPPGISVFHVRPGGPDSIYKFYQEGSGMEIRQRLDRAGLDNRVIAPHHKGFNIIIPDQGSQKSKQVQQYAKLNGVQVQRSQGHLKNVGSPDQAQARDQFRSGVVQGAGPQQMSRGKPIRYSHEAFQKAMQKSPKDSTTRKVYADWIEEHDPQSATPEALNFLRNYDGPALAGVNEYGHVEPVERWTMAAIRQHMQAAGSNWFTPETRRFFSSRIHGQPIHGPHGVAFITSESPGGMAPRFNVRHFEPGSKRYGTLPSISTVSQFMQHGTLEEARAHAKEFVNTPPDRVAPKPAPPPVGS